MTRPGSKLLSAACEVELTGDSAPEWVHLFPPGRTTARDGRVFDLVDPAAVILDFEGRGVDLPVDFDHQLDDGKTRSGPVPAAGWIKELKTEGGSLWGRVEWTATAAQLIAQKAYRYLSPTFLYTPSTAEVVRLTGAGLVHKPALPLKALAQEQSPMNANPTPAGSQGDASLLARLATALGLPADTSEADVMSLVEKLVAVLERLAPKPDAATAAELVKGFKPDPARFVPVEAVQEMLLARNTELATAKEARVKEKVAAALKGGHITPPLRDWATALCTENEASFDAFLAKSGAPWAYLFKDTHMKGPPPGVGRAAEDDGSLAAAVCSQLGLKPGTLSA